MAITPLPTPPSRDDPTNFATRADAFLGALPDFATEANALAVDVNADAVAAAASAVDAEDAVDAAEAAAAAAAAAANVTKWVSGTTYAEGVVVWSPITYLSYRRKIAGAGTTDPSADGTNWAQAAGTGDVTQTGTQTLTNKTLSGAVLNDGYTEEIFAVTGTTPALSPTNGSIQTWTLSGNSTPTAGTWANGQSLTLMVDDGSAYTIDWSSVAVTWKTDGGTAPTLNTTGFTAIQLWKVDTVIYGARVGDA
jgi:hypothetical protein